MDELNGWLETLMIMAITRTTNIPGLLGSVEVAQNPTTTVYLCHSVQNHQTNAAPYSFFPTTKGTVNLTSCGPSSPVVIGP